MILRAGSVTPQRMTGSSPRTEERFGDAAGLRLLGVNIVTLAPGERSSRRHWHSGSDEFVMIIDGTATVIEDEGTAELGPGDMALWPAGVENAHQIVNRGASSLSYLCAGTNPDHELVRYPDEAETLIFSRPLWYVVTDDGRITRQGTDP